MKKRNGSGSRRLVEMTSKFQRSQQKLLDTLHAKGMIAANDLKRMSTAVDRAVAQKRSSDVFSTAVSIHSRVVQALDRSIEDAPQRREVKEIEALLALSSAVQADVRGPGFFAGILEILQRDLAYENATIYLFDREDERLEAVATRGHQVDLIAGVTFDTGVGLSAWVAKRKRPILISELARPGRPGEPPIRSFLSLPLIIQGDMIGVINLSHSRARAFNEDDLRLLKLAGGIVAAALERVVRQRHIERQAVCDRLTGLYNRRHFRERLTAEIERARRHYQPFSLLLIDVDDLEAFNARYGHAAGDRVLVDISKVLQRWGRKADIVSRYDGEEFAVLMPGTGSDAAALAAERLRKCIETHVFPQKRQVTVSVGTACFPTDAEADLDLLAKAEQALFLAKRAGHNRMVAFHAVGVH